MGPEVALPLLLISTLVVSLFGFAYWPAIGDERAGSGILTLLRTGVWGGYGVVVLLLVTDVSSPGWLTGYHSTSGTPGCASVMSAERSFYGRLSPDTCATLADTRLGWALLCAIAATLCLSLLTRMRVRNDIADRLSQEKEAPPASED